MHLKASIRKIRWDPIQNITMYTILSNNWWFTVSNAADKSNKSNYLVLDIFLENVLHFCFRFFTFHFTVQLILIRQYMHKSISLKVGGHEIFWEFLRLRIWPFSRGIFIKSHKSFIHKLLKSTHYLEQWHCCSLRLCSFESISVMHWRLDVILSTIRLLKEVVWLNI